MKEFRISTQNGILWARGDGANYTVSTRDGLALAKVRKVKYLHWRITCNGQESERRHQTMKAAVQATFGVGQG